MPIRWRLTLFNALAIGAMLALLGLFVYLVLREALLSGVEDTVQAKAEEAANVVGAGETLGQEQEEVERLTLDGVYVMARDEQGGVLTRTAGTASRDVEEADDVWRWSRTIPPETRWTRPGGVRTTCTRCRWTLRAVPPLAGSAWSRPVNPMGPRRRPWNL